MSAASSPTRRWILSAGEERDQGRGVHDHEAGSVLQTPVVSVRNHACRAGGGGAGCAGRRRFAVAGRGAAPRGGSAGHSLVLRGRESGRRRGRGSARADRGRLARRLRTDRARHAAAPAAAGAPRTDRRRAGSHANGAGVRAHVAPGAPVDPRLAPPDAVRGAADGAALRGRGGPAPALDLGAAVRSASGLRAVQGRMVRRGRHALPELLSAERDGDHQAGRDRLGRRGGQRHPAAGVSEDAAGRRRRVPRRRPRRLRHRGQRRGPRLPQAHPGLARDGARSARGRRADDRLLHAVRDGHSVRERRRRPARHHRHQRVPVPVEQAHVRRRDEEPVEHVRGGCPWSARWSAAACACGTARW